MNKKYTKITILLIILVILVVFLNEFSLFETEVEDSPEPFDFIEVPKSKVSSPVDSDSDSPPVLESVPEQDILNKKTIFISSKTYNGDLGHGYGGDDKCQELAREAQLSGVFKAWISSTSTNAINSFTSENSAYYDVSNTLIAASLRELAYGRFANPLVKTENGYKLSKSIRIWTGTALGGRKKGDTPRGLPYCYDWTLLHSPLVGSYGYAGQIGSKWTDAGLTYCNQQLRLYCIED